MSKIKVGDVLVKDGRTRTVLKIEKNGYVQYIKEDGWKTWDSPTCWENWSRNAVKRDPK